MNTKGIGNCKHESWIEKGVVCLANDEDDYYITEFNSLDEVNEFVDELIKNAKEAFKEKDSIVPLKKMEVFMSSSENATLSHSADIFKDNYPVVIFTGKNWPIVNSGLKFEVIEWSKPNHLYLV